MSSSKLKVRSSRNLKHKIAIAGFSSKELAETIGITTSYMSTIVNGGSNPSPSISLKIVNEINLRLGTTYRIDDFFFDTSVKKNTTILQGQAVE